jgi:hypothetical protein
LFLSLFFSVTSALVSTLIQQWAREYLQYSQLNLNTQPHKRVRMRTYLFDGLSQFQMRRLTYVVSILLHIAVFLFFFSLSDWLYTINVLVGVTARCCFAVLLGVYIILSVLPLVFKNAPYQTALTTPIRGYVSLIRLLSIAFLHFVGSTSRVSEVWKGSGLWDRIHLGRSRVLKMEIKRQAPKLDQSAMHWLLQQLDEDEMDTFLGGLPGYILSPLTDTKLVVEGLMEAKVPKRIANHLKLCVTSLEHSHREHMSRASTYIKSLHLISQSAPSPTTGQASEGYTIQAIIKDLGSLCDFSNASTALRAFCVRSLVIGEFLVPFASVDAEKQLAKEFPDYLKPLYGVIHVYTTTEIAQWSSLTPQVTSDQLPNGREMWTRVLYDGPLINLAVLAHGVLSCANDDEGDLEVAWKTFKTLLQMLGLSQVRASSQVRERFTDVHSNVRERVNSHEGGRTQIIPLLDIFNNVLSGLRLVEVLKRAPNLPPRQIQAIFGQEQLRNSELLEVFAAHLPQHIEEVRPRMSKDFMELLVLEDKLWEQLHVSLLQRFHRQDPFHETFRTVTAIFDILDVAFVNLKDSSNIDWQSPVFHPLFGYLIEFERTMANDPDTLIKKVASLRVAFASVQFCQALLAQFSMQRGLEEPFAMQSLNALSTLVWVLGLGSQEVREYLTDKNTEATFDLTSEVVPIVDLVLRDGPLENICKLLRLILDLMRIRAPDSTLDKSLKLLRRIREQLDGLHLLLVPASREVWSRFDHIRDAVGPYVSGASALESGWLKSVLEVIEFVEHARLAGVEGADGVEKDDSRINPLSSAALGHWQDLLHSGDVPTPGTSRQVSRQKKKEPIGSSSNLSVSTPGASPIARNVIPSARIPHSQTDPNSMDTRRLLTSSTPSPQPSYPPHWLVQRDYQVRPAHPFIHSMGDPWRTGSSDFTNLPASAYMQPMLTGSPISPSHIPAHPYPPSPSSGPRYDQTYHASAVPLSGSGWNLTPDPGW